MPKAVDKCVKSILKKNPDMPEDQAWAICYDLYNEGKLDKNGKRKNE